MNYPKWLLFNKLVLLAALLFSKTSRACDVCGCGAGNFYFGLMPNADKHAVSMRYRTLAFQSHLYPGDPYAALFKTTEKFEIIEFNGFFRIGKKLRAAVFIPYHFSRQMANNGTHYQQGLADVLLQIQFSVFNSEQKFPDSDWKHEFRTGLASKMPTGSWKIGTGKGGTVENANFQPGTGSWDVLGTVQYLVRKGRMGLQADAQYRMNQSNPDGYKFGNQISGNLNLLRKMPIGMQGSLAPFLGVYAELAQKNQKYQVSQSITGGSLSMFNLGIQAQYKSVTLLGQWQKPLKSHLAENHILPGSRLLFQLGYSF
jgi:hypothetical protein